MSMGFFLLTLVTSSWGFRPFLSSEKLFISSYGKIRLHHLACTKSLRGGLPSISYVQQLKEEELIQFGKSKRKSTHYINNNTAALALPFSRAELKTMSNDEQEFIAMSKDYIIEHANRRVDLFFYTLVAYYKTAFLPILGQTYLQYGKGRSLNHAQGSTEACHSSFLPSLIDKTIYQNKETGKKYRCLLSDTHFMDTINSTVELPCIVNHLDGILEHHLGCRQQCLDILCYVALGTLNPIEGLTEFLKMMTDILDDVQPDNEQNKKPNLRHYSTFGNKTLPAKLIDYVATGTLATTFSLQTQAVSMRYIDSLLSISSEQQRFFSMNREGMKQDYLNNRMRALQCELLLRK